jgi:hypothetical protein
VRSWDVRSSSHLIRLGLVALLLAIVGCGGSQKAIVGKWKVTSDSTAIVWDFAADGSVTSGDIRGRYSFGDQNRMKLQTPFATFVYQTELNGDHMTWKAPNGTKTELTRVK